MNARNVPKQITGLTNIQRYALNSISYVSVICNKHTSVCLFLYTYTYVHVIIHITLRSSKASSLLIQFLGPCKSDRDRKKESSVREREKERRKEKDKEIESKEGKQ